MATVNDSFNQVADWRECHRAVVNAYLNHNVYIYFSATPNLKCGPRCRLS